MGPHTPREAGPGEEMGPPSSGMRPAPPARPAPGHRWSFPRRVPPWLLHGAAILGVASPALALMLRFATEGPGPDPIEDVTHVSGEWGLRTLLLSLAITPARRLLGLRALAPLRRTLGLAAFAWACVHLATWALLDHALDGAAILEDLTERPYVMAGMASFAALLPLAITSTRGWMKRLGPRWVRLHRLVYLAATLAVLHHFWLVKADLRPPLIHAGLLASLLGLRAVDRFRRAR